MPRAFEILKHLIVTLSQVEDENGQSLCAIFGKTHTNISRDDFENNFYLQAAFGKVSDI